MAEGCTHFLCVCHIRTWRFPISKVFIEFSSYALWCCPCHSFIASLHSFPHDCVVHSLLCTRRLYSRLGQIIFIFDIFENTIKQNTMLFPSVLVLASALLIEARNPHEIRHLHDHLHRRQNDNSLTLDTNAIQKGSSLDGSTSVGATPEQVKSETSDSNFINYCSGQELTNGLQIVTGSCNGIGMNPC